MKRHPSLHLLSDQHHNTLVVARHLRLAAAGERDYGEALAEIRDAWEREIQSHFRLEEMLLLPRFAECAGPEDTLIARTLAEHAEIRALAQRLLTAAEPSPTELAALAQILHDHIRFEERELFPTLEAALGEDTLVRLGQELETANGGAIPRCRLR